MASKKKNTDLDEVELEIIATLKQLNGNFEGAVKRMQIVNGTLQNIVQSLGGGNTGGGIVKSIGELNLSIKTIVDDLSKVKINVEAATPPAAIPAPPTINPTPIVPTTVTPSPPLLPTIVPAPIIEIPEEPDQTEQSYFKLGILNQLQSTIAKTLSDIGETFSTFLPTVDSAKMGLSVLSQVSQGINSLPQKIIDLEQSLYGLGTDLDGFTSTMGSVVDGIVGSTTQNLKNAATLYSLGFRDNNKSLLQLAAKMDLTGQNTGALFNELTRTSIVLGLTTNQLSILAKTVDDSSTKYGVKSDELIQTLSKVQNQNVMATAGFGATFMNNLTPLLGEFTKNRTEIINLINALTKSETLMKLAPVDPAIVGLARQLEQATSSKELKAVLIEITARLSSFAQTMTSQVGGAGQIGNMPITALLGDIFSMIGQPIADSTQLFKALTGQLTEQDLALKQQTDLQNSFRASLEQLVNAAMPIAKIFIDLATFFFNFLGPTGAKVTIIIGLFGSMISGLILFGTTLAITRMSLDILRNRLQALGVQSQFTIFGFQMASRSLISAGIGIATWAAAITGGLSLVFAGIAAFGMLMGDNSKQTTDNTDAIRDNTKTIANVNESKFRDTLGQNTMFDMMNRHISYVLSREDHVATALQNIASQTQDQNAFLQKLTDSSMQYYSKAILDMNSPQYGAIR